VTLEVSNKYKFSANNCDFSQTECHFNTTIGQLMDKQKNDKTIFNNYNKIQFFIISILFINYVTPKDARKNK